MQPRVDQISFSVRTAFQMARHASLVYSDNEELTESTLKSWGFDEPIIQMSDDHPRGIRIYLAASSNAIVVSIRGSIENSDLANDAKRLELQPLPWLSDEASNAKAHSGFLEALSGSLLDRLIDSIDTLQAQPDNDGPKRPKHVFVTGHSLGGALATLVAVRLRGVLETPTIGGSDKVNVQDERFNTPLTLYTFGSPRCVNDALACAFDRELRDRTFRVVLGEDMVTQVPFYSWGYSHVGTCVYVNEAGIVSCDAAREETQLAGIGIPEEQALELSRMMVSTAPGGVMNHAIGYGPRKAIKMSMQNLSAFIRNRGYLGALAAAQRNQIYTGTTMSNPRLLEYTQAGYACGCPLSGRHFQSRRSDPDEACGDDPAWNACSQM